MKNNFVKNLSNKQPTKDITLDDLRYKIPKITSKKKIVVKINNDIFLEKKLYQLLRDQMELKVEN